MGIDVVAVLACTIVAAPYSARGQAPPSAAYVCPMHPDVVSRLSGTCRRCRMTLVPTDPFDAREFLIDIAVQPAALHAGDVIPGDDGVARHPSVERVGPAPS